MGGAPHLGHEATLGMGTAAFVSKVWRGGSHTRPFCNCRPHGSGVRTRVSTPARACVCTMDDLPSARRSPVPLRPHRAHPPPPPPPPRPPRRVQWGPTALHVRLHVGPIWSGDLQVPRAAITILLDIRSAGRAAVGRDISVAASHFRVLHAMAMLASRAQLCVYASGLHGWAMNRATRHHTQAFAMYNALMHLHQVCLAVSHRWMMAETFMMPQDSSTAAAAPSWKDNAWDGGGRAARTPWHRVRHPCRWPPPWRPHTRHTSFVWRRCAARSSRW